MLVTSFIQRFNQFWNAIIVFLVTKVVIVRSCSVVSDQLSLIFKVGSLLSSLIDVHVFTFTVNAFAESAKSFSIF